MKNIKIATILQRDPYVAEKGTYIRYRATLQALIQICLTKKWELNILVTSSSDKLCKAVNSLLKNEERTNVRIFIVSQKRPFSSEKSENLFHKFVAMYFKNPFTTLQVAIPVIKNSDIVIFFEPYNQALLAILARLHKKKIIFDLQNSETLLAQSILANSRSLKTKLPGLIWYAYGLVTESLLLKLVDLLVVPSDIDVNNFTTRYGNKCSKRLTIIPNVIDASCLAPKAIDAALHGRKEQGVLFIGDMSYPPNKQGAEIIISHIAPKLCRKDPQIHLYIVGRSPPLIKSPTPNVHILSYVPDLFETITKCKVAIAPIYSGAGIKYKILTYLSYGLPVIATPKAVEGLDSELTKLINVVAKPEDFVKAILQVIDNYKNYANKSKKGKEYVLKNYVAGPNFTKKWNNALELASSKRV